MNWMKSFKKIVLVFTLGMSMSGCADTLSWKEEVLLHDGSKIIINRSQVHGGRGELGQSPIKEQTVSFTLPNSNELIIWKSEYSEDVGRSNFDLRAIHVLKGTPYIVAEPNLCLSYNKWGRPNPPYVIFKYVRKTWQRIKLEELPHEFTAFNVVQNNFYEGDYEGEKLLVKLSYINADKVKELNGKPEFNVILRKPIDDKRDQILGCEVMVRYKDGEYNMWTTPEGFKEPQRVRKLGGAQPVELIDQLKE